MEPVFISSLRRRHDPHRGGPQRRHDGLFAQYLKTLAELHLPVHEPQVVPDYRDVASRRKYWEIKSKQTFRWGDPTEGGIPWIGFLGLEFNHSGLIRPRLKSFHKHREKLIRETSRMLSSLGLLAGQTPARNVQSSYYRILAQMRFRLIAIGVGRVRIGPGKSRIRPRCWASAFADLRDRPAVKHWIRKLDRERERQFSRIRRRLQKLHFATQPARKLKKVRIPRRIGRPFSYFAQFWK